MKCPKCYFIGFDNGQRCKNCGYQFSLTVDDTPFELPLKTGHEPLGPLADFPIEPVGTDAQPRTAPTTDLPLFGLRGEDDDRPLVTLPASPRAPVAVRKSSPAVRPAPPKRTPAYEPELELEPAPAIEPPPAPHIVQRQEPARPAGFTRPASVGDRAEPQVATTVARLSSAMIDLCLVLAIDAVVLYLTLRICGLTFAEWEIIPRAPFLAFVAMLNGGYMAGATAANGQSLGKAILGIKVITADPEAGTDRVPLGTAVVRTAGYLISALPAGLGFVPALVGEGRALHDRLAHTRVVKA
jgi:uncharacterized RDD family membrane protein YckC